MTRQSLLAYLTRKTDVYENKSLLGMTGASGGDLQSFFSPICERPLKHSGYDVFGVNWTYVDPSSHYTQGQEPILKNIQNWKEEVRIPVIERFDWGYVDKQVQSFDRESKVIIVTLAIGPFERTSSLSSFEDCLANSITDPEEYADLIGAIANYKIEIIHHLCRLAHPDIVNLHDDWGTSISTFFRPEYWREVIKPHTQRMYDAIKEHGALICQHSDGAIGPLIGDMVEMGAHIWEGGREIPDQLAVFREQYDDRLCIVVPPEKKEAPAYDKSKATVEVIPDVKTMPLNYQPYDEVPTFLYQ